MAYKHDMEGYWEAYKDVQNQIFGELHGVEAPPHSGPVFEYVHFVCVYCHERFETLEQIQAHYTRNQVGADPTLIPMSRRGATEESWRRGQKVINAPTIRSVS